MITVVYPLIKSKWGEEIKYSLRSLERFAEMDCRVIIYSDYIPEWLDTNAVELVRIPKFKHMSPGTGTQFNQGLIFQMLIDRPDVEDFVFFNDDIYLLQPIFTFNQVYMLKGTLNRAMPKLSNAWYTLLHETRIDLDNRGHSSFNYETHLPYPVNCNKLRLHPEVLKGQQLMATAYYNYRGVGAKPLASSVKISYMGEPAVNGNSRAEDIYQRYADQFGNPKYKFFNHNDAGLPLAKYILPLLFPNKSRFELCT